MNRLPYMIGTDKSGIILIISIRKNLFMWEICSTMHTKSGHVADHYDYHHLRLSKAINEMNEMVEEGKKLGFVFKNASELI